MRATGQQLRSLTWGGPVLDRTPLEYIRTSFSCTYPSQSSLNTHWNIHWFYCVISSLYINGRVTVVTLDGKIVKSQVYCLGYFQNYPKMFSLHTQEGLYNLSNFGSVRFCAIKSILLYKYKLSKSLKLGSNLLIQYKI